jgi:hypothetical protein
MLTVTSPAGGRHIRRIMSGGSTPDPTIRTQVLTELTSDAAMTLQMSAHARTTANSMSSSFMIAQFSDTRRRALSRNAQRAAAAKPGERLTLQLAT